MADYKQKQFFGSAQTVINTATDIAANNFSGAPSAAFDNTSDGSAMGGTSAVVCILPGSSASANYCSAATVTIDDYRGTTFFKAGQATASRQLGTASGDLTAMVFGFGWRSTSAITSITLLLGSGNFVAGSKFTLYGLT